MTSPTNINSQITYLELEKFTCSEFVKQLVFIHASLQRQACMSDSSHELIRLKAMQWWYRIAPISARCSNALRDWVPLTTETFEIMLNYTTDCPDHEESAVEFTNDLSSISFDYDLVPTASPLMVQVLNNGNEITVPIRPCFLRLSRAAILSLPDQAHNKPSQVAASIQLACMSDVGAGPQGQIVDGHQIISVYPSSNDEELQDPHVRHPNTPGTEQDSFTYPSPLLHSELPSSPLNANTESSLSPTADMHEDLLGASFLEPYFIVTSEHTETPSPPESRLQYDGDTILARPTVSVKLYLRPPPLIARRYSDRFDTFTFGLHGSYPIRGCRSRELPGSQDVTMTLDLAGARTGEDVAVGDGGRWMNWCPSVDLKRGLLGTYGVDTSALWSGN